jgi:hypothetical protein
MVFIPKVVGIISCSFLLGLGLSTAVRAESALSTADNMKADQSDRRQGGQEAGEKQIPHTMKTDDLRSGKMIEGKVLRVEGDTWFVKEADGKEVQLHIDPTTQMSERTLIPGDIIEARLDDQNHVLSISSPDRRNDHMLETEQTNR